MSPLTIFPTTLVWAPCGHQGGTGWGSARRVRCPPASRSTTSSSAPRGARTSISTGWWRSVRHAMPKRMPPTRAAGWSSPHSATGASASRSPGGLTSGRSARSSGPSMARALGAPRSQGAPGVRSGDDPRNNRTPRDRGPARLGAGCADERGMVGHPAAGLAAHAAALLGNRMSARRGGLPGALPQ